MGQLIRITSTPYQAVSFSQNARLISSDSVDVERRKAIARHIAFRSHYTRSSSPDLRSVNQINHAFSIGSSPAVANNPLPRQNISSNLPSAGSAAAKQEAAVSVPSPNVDSSEIGVFSFEYEGSSAAIEVPALTENQAAYLAQRGALELRVAKGDLSFVPPLVMTIVTQYPSIQIEYIGGFNYVPPSKAPTGGTVNFSI